MTKSDLIERMSEARKVPTGRAEQIVNAIFDAIEQALNRGERVEIRGLGSFEVRDYRGYTGRNPRTGTTVEVKPKRLAFFKVGKELKDRVQRGARGAAGATPGVAIGPGNGKAAPAARPGASTSSEAPRANPRSPIQEHVVGVAR